MNQQSILFLTNAYPDFDGSYRGNFIKEMASLLQETGCDISVVTPKIFRRSRYLEEQNGIKVYRFPFFSGNKLLIEHKKIPYGRMILYFATGFLLTIFVGLKHRPSLIHAHWAIPTGLIGVFAGILLRRPMIVTIHGSDYRMGMEGSFFLKVLFLFVCRKAKHIICVSEVLKKGLKEEGIEEKKISVFPMGVDNEFLKVGKSRKRTMDAQSFTVLSNRNLLPIYNVSLFIQAISLVVREEPVTRFLIAGEGPEREELEREARRLDLGRSVQFLGRVPHEEMSDLLSRVDIYVSTSPHDGTSISLLEAMASGAFPVVADIPSNREWIIDGENGFLVPTGDKDLLAKRVVEAIRAQAHLDRIRDQNLSIIEEKALWSVNIMKVRGIYEKVLEPGKQWA